MPITFGVTVLPDPPYGRFLGLLELAEAWDDRDRRGPVVELFVVGKPNFLK